MFLLHLSSPPVIIFIHYRVKFLFIIVIDKLCVTACLLLLLLLPVLLNHNHYFTLIFIAIPRVIRFFSLSNFLRNSPNFLCTWFDLLPVGGCFAFEWHTCMFVFVCLSLLMVWNFNLRTELERKGLTILREWWCFLKRTKVRGKNLYDMYIQKQMKWWGRRGVWGHTGVDYDEWGDVFVMGERGGLTKLYQLKAIYVEEKKISFCFGFCVFYKFLLFFSLQNIHIYI